MNWLARIKYILGSFWFNTFYNLDFVRGVVDTLTLYGKLQEASHRNWESGLIVNSTEVVQDKFPVSVYIDISSVRAPYSSFEDILNNGTIEEPKEASGWVADSLYPIADPYCLTDHVLDYTRVLLAGFDYEYANGQFLFYVDPVVLDLPTVKLVDHNGDLKVYFVLFGWSKRKHVYKDAVAGLLGAGLNTVAAEAWEVHQQGATFYNVKKLLGAITGAVICKEDGVVEDLWEEQGYICIRINDTVYSGPSSLGVNVEIGDEVLKGAILLGTMKFFSGRDLPSFEEVPGMRIRTDVGELTAPNLVQATGYDPYNPGQGRVLPLTGDALVVDAYRNLCYTLNQDLKCPYTELPVEVNPFQFIMQTLRRGRGCLVSLTAEHLQALEDSLGVIRKNICASGILNVYVKAEGDVAGVTVSGFTADVGNAAVSVDATITIKNASATIKVLI